MCGRYIIVETIEAIDKRFSVRIDPIQYKINFNVAPSQSAPIITSDDPSTVKFYRFGMTPYWAKKPNFFINARCEGDHNLEDDPGFNGAKGIIEKPAFKKPIRTQRCLVIASAFIEGPKDIGLSQPYLIYLRNRKRPFAMAGVWDAWHDENKGETIYGFSIITTTANELLQKIGHHRMPVIIHPENEKIWLKSNSDLRDITPLLKKYPVEEMNAYSISPEIKNPKNNSKTLIMPLGDPLLVETEYKIEKGISIQGFGHRKK